MSTKDLRSAIWRFCARTGLAGDPYELGLQTRRQLRRGYDGSAEQTGCKDGVKDATSRATLYVIIFDIESQYNQGVLASKVGRVFERKDGRQRCAHMFRQLQLRNVREAHREYRAVDRRSLCPVRCYGNPFR